MSKTGRPNQRRGTRGNPRPERRITVRAVRRDPPDLRKLSRAVIAIAMAEAEAEAQAATVATSATESGTAATETNNSERVREEVDHDD
ncbi:hypothetical protein ACHIPZ_06495 [Antrihabitans sp. NCIMB 15449]|uniref:Uncharacterized protein n=1 Tax=Antrihabitans spumae TaxID=3373370 RepID=A0ABW7JJD6_9NOCA